jgi:hypothetical protein
MPPQFAIRTLLCLPLVVFDLDNVAYIRDELKYPGCQIALRVDRDLIASDGCRGPFAGTPTIAR